jgi:hypothetical protein
MEVMLEFPNTEPHANEATVCETVAVVELVSFHDEVLCRRGDIKPEEIRRLLLPMGVDLNSSSLVSLPEYVIKQLDVRLFREDVSRDEHGHPLVEMVYGPLKIIISNRINHVLTVAGKPGSPPRLGQLALEGMDLANDAQHRKIVPGHPDSPDMPVYYC